MINCEHCEVKSRSQSGMAMHVRGSHPDKWKGSVKASFSEGFDIGQHEPGAYHKPTKEEYQKSLATRAAKRSVPAVARKGQKKAPIHQKCPWCKFNSIHPPAMAAHIKREHPKKWKGRLSVTLGKPLSTADKYLDRKKSLKGYIRMGRPPGTRNLKEKPAGEVRIPNNFCMECGADQRPAQLAKGFMNHGTNKHGNG